LTSRIVFIVESTFQKWEHQRFGIDLLRSNRFEVEIWDLTPFMHPGCEKQNENLKEVKDPGYHLFRTRDEAFAAIAGLDNASFVVCMVVYSRKALPLYRALSKSQAAYGVVYVYGQPETKQPPEIFIRKLLRNASPAIVAQRFFRAVPFKTWGIRPAATLVLAGTTSMPAFRYPVDATTRILWGHSFDYDVYLNELQRPSEAPAAPTAVFLDECIPNHPDYAQIGIPAPCRDEEYYPPLGRFFDWVEKNHGLKVVIAAHPRSDYGESRPFGNRPVVKGKTAELVRTCQCVMSHASTSVNFAVLFNKPLVFLTLSALENVPREKNRIHSMAGWFKKAPLLIDAIAAITEKDWRSSLALDRAAYERYRETFIKSAGSPEKPQWQLFADFLLAGAAPRGRFEP